MWKQFEIQSNAENNKKEGFSLSFLLKVNSKGSLNEKHNYFSLPAPLSSWAFS